MPTLLVSPSSAAVGDVVTVQFGPAVNGCGTPVFESSAGSSALPYDGVGGSANGISGVEDFVIPRTLTSTSTGANVPVSPGSYEFSLICDTTNEPATAQSVSVPFTVTAPNPERFVGIAPSATGDGYWLAQAGGGVRNFGQAVDAGGLPSEGITPYGSVVGIASTSDGKGYWLTGTDGGVFSFGDAQDFGSIGGETLNQPVVGMASTPDGKGYWLVASDGGVFSFGDAQDFGSMAGKTLNQPVVGMASTPDGRATGWWPRMAVCSALGMPDLRFDGGEDPQPADRGGKPRSQHRRVLGGGRRRRCLRFRRTLLRFDRERSPEPVDRRDRRHCERARLSLCGRRRRSL